MGIHDWTRVDAGIFHHFHLGWIDEIAQSLNNGRLPEGYYALAEQFVGAFGPDVLTLRSLTSPTGPSDPEALSSQTTGAESTTTLISAEPQIDFHFVCEADRYVARQRSVVVRRKRGHEVVAVVEIVSQGNKSSARAMDALVTKCQSLIESGVHTLVVDLFPPGPRDPEGLHQAIWDRFSSERFRLPVERPLCAASYLAGDSPEAFVQPFAVGEQLRDMPLYLRRDGHLPVPLAASYESAWRRVPSVWRDVLED